MTKKEKLIKFVKDHKKEIIFGTVTIVGAIGLGAIVRDIGKIEPKLPSSTLSDDSMDILEVFKELCGNVDKMAANGAAGYIPIVGEDLQDLISNMGLQEPITLRDPSGVEVDVVGLFAFVDKKEI